MAPIIELLNAALKQGVSYGVFFLLFCTGALLADSQGYIDLAALGPGARTIATLGLMAAAIVMAISGVSRGAGFLWPRALKFEQSRRALAARRNALAIQDAEVMANLEILPKREKLLLALVMHKGNQRFPMFERSDEFYGLIRKGIVHLPPAATGKDVFLVRDNVWAKRDAVLEEQTEEVRKHLTDVQDPIAYAKCGGWNSGLEF